jgi:hypothetical protein
MNSLEPLQGEIKNINGVIEAAVFLDNASHPVEIQVWIYVGSSEREIRIDIARILSEHGMLQYNERIYVFELSPGSPDPKKAMPVGPVSDKLPEKERAPAQAFPKSVPTKDPVPAAMSSATSERKRPRIAKISLSSSTSAAHADVSLTVDNREAAATGDGPRTPYALRVTAATTLEAVHALIEAESTFTLIGVSLIEVMEERMVVVLVDSVVNGRKLVGSALVGDSQVYEATVRATLDGVNRQLSNHL